MTTVFAACAVLACFAWIAEGAYARRLEGRINALRDECDDLRFQYEAQCSELRTKRQLLTEALAAMPNTPRGRELGDAIRVTAWDNRKVGRLQRHLNLVDGKEPA